jgi:hypothetical protein
LRDSKCSSQLTDTSQFAESKSPKGQFLLRLAC